MGRVWPVMAVCQAGRTVAVACGTGTGHPADGLAEVEQRVAVTDDHRYRQIQAARGVIGEHRQTLGTGFEMTVGQHHVVEKLLGTRRLQAGGGLYRREEAFHAVRPSPRVVQRQPPAERRSDDGRARSPAPRARRRAVAHGPRGSAGDVRARSGPARRSGRPRGRGSAPPTAGRHPSTPPSCSPRRAAAGGAARPRGRTPRQRSPLPPWTGAGARPAPASRRGSRGNAAGSVPMAVMTRGPPWRARAATRCRRSRPG